MKWAGRKIRIPFLQKNVVSLQYSAQIIWFSPNCHSFLKLPKHFYGKNIQILVWSNTVHYKVPVEGLKIWGVHEVIQGLLKGKVLLLYLVKSEAVLVPNPPPNPPALL